jgi:fatty-acid peroxygenase
MGEEATHMFYESGRFTRKGAVPSSTLMLLQVKGSVQTLDHQPHHHRKQMFMSLMMPTSIQKLVGLMVDQWHSRLDKMNYAEVSYLIGLIHIF